MGLFDNIFSKTQIKASQKADSYFQTLTAYSPAFTTWSGKLYESELVRAAIDARARHISKLSVTVDGSAKPKLQTILRIAPNSFQTWSQFLYRVSTILDMQNTAFIVPVTDEYGAISGYYPVLPSRCELVQVKKQPWIRYHFYNGSMAAVPVSECGIMTKFQYKDDFFGENNNALGSTMQLLSMQKQGVEEAIKNSASYRFMAQVNNFTKADDLAKERKRFTSENLSSEADGGGLLLFPNTYTNIQQLSNKAYTVDADQLKLIQTNVFNYFGVNEAILQNTADGNALDAFFNGAIEPFSIQLSDVMTRMSFSGREIANGSCISVTSNRLMYMPVSVKVQLAQQLGDRGMVTIDEIRALFNYPPLPNGAGEHTPIRGEYYFGDQGKQAKPEAGDKGDNYETPVEETEND